MLKITFMGMHYIYKKGKLTNDWLLPIYSPLELIELCWLSCAVATGLSDPILAWTTGQ